MTDDGGFVVRAAGAELRPAPGEVVTFGRSPTCTICLDPDDAAISRRAGTIEQESGAWWLTNSSKTRPVAVVDEVGFRSVLPPGRRVAIEGRIRVLIDGAEREHELVLEAPVPRSETPSVPSEGLPTTIGAEVVINDADRAALVALFAGYLEEGKRYDPYPKSYAAAAARLGWPRTTLVKRIEYLRNRLAKAGVPNMQGWNALTHLAEHVLTAGIITREDLRLINR